MMDLDTMAIQQSSLRKYIIRVFSLGIIFIYAPQKEEIIDLVYLVPDLEVDRKDSTEDLELRELAFKNLSDSDSRKYIEYDRVHDGENPDKDQESSDGDGGDREYEVEEYSGSDEDNAVKYND